MDNSHLLIALLLASGFFLASVFGNLARRIGISPVIAYLLSGYLIGPYSPVTPLAVDNKLASQLAELGVILMLFSVGMHFKLQDLYRVKGIAIPGALVQVGSAIAASAYIIAYFSGDLKVGVIVGIAIGVASTVVLIRELSDNNLLDSQEGHIAVGWLIVEDLFTVIALVLLPLLADFDIDSFSLGFLKALLEFFLLAAVLLTLGKKLVTYFLQKSYEMQSHELFTITVLGLAFALPVFGAIVFSTSVALGAFLTGIIIGSSDIRHKVQVTTIPFKDAFVVFFFVAVGMIFNPKVIVDHFVLCLVVTAIILLVKPLSAYLITRLLRYPVKTALTVAVALSQIGEFSFILAESALQLRLIPHHMYDAIIAAAIVTISLNPFFFRQLNITEKV